MSSSKLFVLVICGLGLAVGVSSECADTTNCVDAEGSTHAFCGCVEDVKACCPFDFQECCDEVTHKCAPPNKCDRRHSLVDAVLDLPKSAKVAALDTRSGDCGGTICNTSCCPLEEAYCCPDGLHCSLFEEDCP